MCVIRQTLAPLSMPPASLRSVHLCNSNLHAPSFQLHLSDDLPPRTKENRLTQVVGLVCKCEPPAAMLFVAYR